MSDPNATPPGPPAPPAPPVPPVPPVPQYGEYAPGGYVAAQPVAGPSHSPQAYGAAFPPQQAAERTRKTWDLVLTSILLALGLIGMLLGVFYGTNMQTLLTMVFEQQGYGAPSGDFTGYGTTIWVSHLLLYALAVGVSIPLLLKKRVAFWVPLSIGVVAAIIFWISFVAAIVSDPAFVNQVY